MQISEIRVKLVEKRNDRLKAFCSVTFDDDFVVRDLKIIEGATGYFVAMPSRKIADRCSKCRSKNHLRAKFCNECGKRLEDDRGRIDFGRVKLHADVAHPINSKCREMLQTNVIDAFHEELEKSQQPGYVPLKMDDTDEDLGFTSETEPSSDQGEPVPEPTSSQTADEEISEDKHDQSGFSEGIL